MTRRQSVLGALLLSALSLCAFGAANASATTLFVCQEVTAGTGKWEDSNCEKAKEKGNFGTVAAPEGVATEIAGTNVGTFTVNIASFTSAVLAAECKKATFTGSATNQLVGGVMQSVGKENNLKLTECTVPLPLGEECKVKEPLEFKGATSTTFMKTETQTRVKFSPIGLNFMEVVVEKCKTLQGMILQVVGSLVGIPSGSTMSFTKESSAEGGLSLAGEPFSIVGTLQLTAKGKKTMLE
jgi:hypothetical protein